MLEYYISSSQLVKSTFARAVFGKGFSEDFGHPQNIEPVPSSALPQQTKKLNMIFGDPALRRKFIKKIIFWVMIIIGILALFFWPTDTHHGSIEESLNANNKVAIILDNNKGVKNTSLITFFGRSILSAGSLQVEAQPIDPCAISPCVVNFKNEQGDSIGQTANNIIILIARIMTFVAASVALVYLVLNGFTMLTSDGDSKKYLQGWNGVLYSILGLIVTVAAYTIIALVLSLLDGFSI